MFAHGVAALVGNHCADKLVEAVDGGFVEDALVTHHSHHMRPRPVLLFRGDDGINMANDINQLLGHLLLTETGHEVTWHLAGIEYLTFTQAFQQLLGFIRTAHLLAPL